ncbi:MAG: hypothetical protein AAF533_07820 [Acidobacteriota bacterium]
MTRDGTHRSALIPLLVLLAGALLGSCAKEEPKPRAKLEPTVPSATGLTIRPALLDLGLVAPGAYVEGSVRIRNDSPRDVEIESLQVPCHCTTTALDLPLTLTPGKEITLPVQLDLSALANGGRARPGPSPDTGVVEKEIIVRTGLGREETIRLEATVSEEILIEPFVLELGRVVVGETALAEMVISPGPAREVLAIQDVVSDDPQVTIERIPIGNEELLAVGYRAIRPLGERVAEISVISDADPPRATARIRMQVVEAVAVQPSSIVSLQSFPNKPIVKELRVVRPNREPFEITGLGTNSGRVSYEIVPPRVQNEQRIRVVVPVLPYPREEQSVLLIDTDVPGARRLEVPIHVRSRPPS